MLIFAVADFGHALDRIWPAAAVVNVELKKSPSFLDVFAIALGFAQYALALLPQLSRRLTAASSCCSMP